MSKDDDSRGGGFHLWAGGLILAGLVLAALAAPWLAPHDPLALDLGQRLLPPAWDHPLGTDHLGRCQLSRLIWGGRVSLILGILASALSWGMGLVGGVAAGLAGRRLDWPLARIIDVGLAFPGLLLALVLVGTLGANPWALVLALAGAGWPWWARLTRSLVRAARGQPFVLGGRAAGVGGWRMLRRYILPQIWPALAVAAAMKTGWMIVAISGLGYLGLSVPAPEPEWGAMLNQARLYLTRAPWLMLSPGAAIFSTVLGCNLLAEGLRQRWQVRQINAW
ncbi:MAG: ABC transporter permease subunit [Desulfarculus sp.]|nr:ABC transporter permease subunit [Desulfarculus sp.]